MQHTNDEIEQAAQRFERLADELSPHNADVDHTDPSCDPPQPPGGDVFYDPDPTCRIDPIRQECIRQEWREDLHVTTAAWHARSVVPHDRRWVWRRIATAVIFLAAITCGLAWAYLRIRRLTAV